MAAPVRVPSGPGILLNPTIVVDRHGDAAVAWVQRSPEGDGAVEIRLAQAPAWRPETVAIWASAEPLSREGAAALHPLVTAGDLLHLAWTEPSTATVMVWRYTHGAGHDAEPWSDAVPYTAALAVAPDGNLSALWVEENGLILVDGAAPLASRLTLEGAISPTEIDLALDAAGRPHVAWAGYPMGADAGIFYAVLDTDAAPTRVDDAGEAPRLAVGPGGMAHLCWRRPEGLHCADSRDWGRISAVAPSLPDARVALAVGPNDVAHVAWSVDGALWYAHSGDWSAARRLADLDAASVSMAIDGAGRPHLAVTVEAEGGNTDLYVLTPFSPEPQLAIEAPAAGAWLAEGDRLAAVANLPAPEWQRVSFYLQPDGSGAETDDALILVGTDYDGRDGWSVPYVAGLLGAGAAPCRVVAVGVDVHGGVTTAVGGPVTALPPGGDVWVVHPGPEVVHGMGRVLVAAPDIGDDLARVEVALTAPGCPALPPPGEAVCTIPSRTFLVASLDVASSGARRQGEWLSVTYDSRVVPDGAYRLSAVVIDADGRQHAGVAAGMVTIDNHLAPTVRIIEPLPGATARGTFRVTAEVEAAAAPVERVVFFLERGRTLLHRSEGAERHRVETPDAVWLGSDTDGADGWGIRVTAAPHLDGDDWTLRVVAYDAQGRSAVARSEDTFAIVGRDRPVARFVEPLPEADVTGIVPVVVQVIVGGRNIAAVDLYAETLGERLIPVGGMVERAGRWMHDLDTTGLPDGDYALVAIVRHVDGRSSLVRSGAVHVSHAAGGAHLVVAEGDDTLRGAPMVRLQGAPGASEVWVYYRDAAGRLRLIGPAAPDAGEWSLAWDTAGVLDGDYDLVAAIHGDDGQVRYAERRVAVRNAVDPSLSAWPAAGDVIGGAQRLAWQVEGEARIALDWSPDGGVHWIALATDLDPHGEFVWDTTRWPDTPRAMLRLLSAGWRRAIVETGPFTIDNTNEAPRVALVAPVPGAAHGAPVFVAWRAWDVDGDPLEVELDYRHGLGAWQPLARDLAGERSYSWDTAGLAPAADYILRVTVRDPSGAEASDEVAGLSLLANRPPSVRLVTPNERTLLRGDAVILWQAEDPEGAPLSIDLYYSDDAGQVWLPLAEGIDNTGYYTWQVSFLPMGSRYRVRVVASDGYYRVSDDSDGMLTVGGRLAPTLHVLRPAHGGRVAGLVPVEWESTIAASTALTATVTMRAVGDAWWRPLATDVPDDGLLIWDTTTVPDGAYELQVTVGNSESAATAMVPVTVANRRNERPAVQLVAPTGGEVWRGVREFVWRAWDNDGDPLSAVIEVSADGGATWQDVAQVDAALGRHRWDTSALQGGHRLLARVVVSDGLVTAQAVTPAPFVVANGCSGPTARFLSPDADGNLWRNGIVTWEVGPACGLPARVSLALRGDGGAPPGAAWQAITEAAYDAGEAVIPAERLTPGQAYRLRLIADDGVMRVATLSAPFGVVMAGSEPPAVTLEQPTGEVWSGEREIRWQARTPDERDLRATLELSRDGGVTWFDLARDVANTGQYAWDTTTVANGAYRLRLTVGDERAASVASSGPFEVENPGGDAPVLSLIAPRAGEVWAGTREVRWRLASADARAATMTLAYSLDGGGTWRRFAYNVPASEGYLWDTTTVPNGEAVWLRATVSDGTLVAEDYAGPFGVRNAQSPVVVLLEPRGGEEWAGERRIAWYTAHGAERAAKTMLQYSLDRGRTWQTIAHDLPAAGSYRWDTAVAADGSEVLVRAYVSDGQQSAVGMTCTPVRVRRPSPGEGAPFYLP